LTPLRLHLQSPHLGTAPFFFVYWRASLHGSQRVTISRRGVARSSAERLITGSVLCCSRSVRCEGRGKGGGEQPRQQPRHPHNAKSLSSSVTQPSTLGHGRGESSVLHCLTGPRAPLSHAGTVCACSSRPLIHYIKIGHRVPTPRNARDLNLANAA
jgi:hypothetical protein